MRRQSLVRIEFSKSSPSAVDRGTGKTPVRRRYAVGAIGPVPGDREPDLYLIFTDGILELRP